MLLTNYDFYDIYWSIVLISSDGLEYDYAVSKAIKDTIDAEPKDGAVEVNIIRRALSGIKELENYKKWQWIFTKNVYTYGVEVIREDVAYQILSAIFQELLICLEAPNEDQINDFKVAVHKIPIILANRDKYWKKHIAHEIHSYRNKWNKQFLKKC